MTHETTIDLLAAWDRGEPVWSIEMGGMGPGYEQAIQVLMMECLRELLRVGLVWPPDEVPVNIEEARAIYRQLDAVTKRVNQWPGCGFSGAQVDAAQGLACQLHRYGPGFVDRAPEERRIMVSRSWPHQPEET